MSYRTVLAALSPSAYWPLSEPTTPNEVVAGLTTTLESGAALGVAGALPMDRAAIFDGTDDRINITHTAAVSLTTNWSVSFLFNGDGFSHGGGGNFPRILSKGSGSGVGYQFLVDSAAGPKIAVQTQGLSDTSHQTVTNIAAATWYHVVTTYDGANVKIYLDGALDYTGPATGSVTTNATALYIGQRGDAANRWDGKIAHVSIWNGTVLTAGQVTALYAARLVGAVALTQARAGIERAGASRAGYFTPNVVVTINGSTVVIDRHSLRLALARNDEPDAATFFVPRTSASAVVAGQSVVIGLGTAANPVFAGQIQSVSHVRYRNGQSPRYSVVCIDWAALFNRLRITMDFSGQSATAIAQTIIADYTSGFYDYAIEPGLATIEEFICINETPLGALRRLANILDGGCDIYPSKIVALWDSSGPSSYYTPTAPVAISSTTPTLDSFTPEYDVSQIRTRVIVEGKQTTCPLSIPADVALPGVQLLPVEDSSAFSVSGGTARIGTQVVTYTSRNYPVVYGVNPEGTHVTADAAAGATSIQVDDVNWVVTTGTNWCQIGDQTVYFNGATGGAPSTLDLVPASGFGSLQHSVGAGDSVRALGELVGVSGLTVAQDAGVEVVVRVETDDAAAQAVVAAVEGGDGIHEHVVVDGRLSVDGATTRAQVELDALGATLLRASWITRDMTAVPGTQQTISLGSPDVISATLMIDSVLLEFPAANVAPLRRCEGSTVKLAGLIEAISG